MFDSLKSEFGKQAEQFTPKKMARALAAEKKRTLILFLGSEHVGVFGEVNNTSYVSLSILTVQRKKKRVSLNASKESEQTEREESFRR